MHLRATWLISFGFLFFLAPAMWAKADSSSNKIEIGVYYYPGWGRSSGDAPWKRIEQFSELRPSIGWYDGDNVSTMRWQIAQMQRAALDLIVFNWYWNYKNGKEHLSAPLSAFTKVPHAPLKFALAWTNNDFLFSRKSDASRAAETLAYYLCHDDYYRIDGRPSLLIWSPANLIRTQNRLSWNLSEDVHNAMVSDKTCSVHEKPLLISLRDNDTTQERAWLAEHGFEMSSAYNYHLGVRNGKIETFSHSYQELIDGYKEKWISMIQGEGGRYIVPTTSGWNKKPWGGSQDPKHDDSSGGALLFKRHLMDAFAFNAANKNKTYPLVLICCWNEYGEGSVVEPHGQDGDTFVKVIKETMMGWH